MGMGNLELSLVNKEKNKTLSAVTKSTHMPTPGIYSSMSVLHWLFYFTDGGNTTELFKPVS